MRKAEMSHLKEIKELLEKRGYSVEIDKDGAYLDVWGYERILGKKRRRKCFEEIYCVINTHRACITSYWSTNRTYKDNENTVEVEQGANGDFRGIDMLLSRLSVEPLKPR